MKEILKEVFQKINWTSTIKSVTDKGFEKLAASAGLFTSTPQGLRKDFVRTTKNV